MNKALCKKDFYVHFSNLNKSGYLLLKDKYYEFNIIYEVFNKEFGKYKFIDVMTENIGKTRFSIKNFEEYFYTEKELRKIKIKKINYEKN